jgi:hypothetical protein
MDMYYAAQQVLPMGSQMYPWSITTRLEFQVVVPRISKYLDSNQAGIFSDPFIVGVLGKNPIYLIEQVFEEVRLSSFPLKPCRWTSTHLCLTQAEAESFSRMYKSNAPRPYIYRISVTTSGFIGDQYHLNGGVSLTGSPLARLGLLGRRANDYWNGAITGSAIREVLCDPATTSVAAQVNYLP